MISFNDYKIMLHMVAEEVNVHRACIGIDPATGMNICYERKRKMFGLFVNKKGGLTKITL